MTVELDMENKTVIVTGAGRGIGAEIATRFAEAGADIVGAARTESELERTVDRVEGHGVRGLAVPTDLSQADDVDHLVDRVLELSGVPDVLVNNAAANLAGDPLSQDAVDLDTMVSVNLRGLYLLSQRVAQEQIDTGVEGRIVNVSSIVGHLGVPAMTLYGGTKAAVHGVTRGLAAELAPHGITVNSVSPGMTRVDRIEDLMAEKGELYDVDRIPAGRLGTPEDVADSCLFLASDLAGYVTGEDLRVDGGVTITAGLYR